PHNKGHGHKPSHEDSEAKRQRQAMSGPVHAHPPSGRIGGSALLANRPVHEGGKQAKRDAHPPDQIIGTIEIVEFSAEPNAEERSDLMAEEHEAVERRNLAGAEHD